MLTKVVLFDFDGVLVDSVSIKEHAFGLLYEEYGRDIMERVMAHHRQHGGMSRFDKFEHYHTEFLGRPLQPGESEDLNQRFSSLVVELVIAAKEMKHATNVLQALSDNFPVHLVSATPEKELIHIVAARGMQHFFRSLHGAPQKKSSHICNIRERYGYEKEQMVFIGDAINDYEASIEADIDFIGYVPPHIKNAFPKHVTVINDLNNIKTDNFL